MPAQPRTARGLPVVIRELTVSRVAAVSPGMLRVTLGGHELGSFVGPGGDERPAFSSVGFDDDIRLLFPYPGERTPVLPEIVDGRVTFAPGRRPIARAYTIRGFREDPAEIDLDFVIHGTGLAAEWAAAATPGDRIHIVGPHRTGGLPSGDWLLIVGDDTALPAIGRLLEELPAEAVGTAIIEIAADSHRQPLTAPDGIRIEWVLRDPQPGSADDFPLLRAVRALPWREGAPFAWIAGEQSQVRTLRRFLVGERGVPKSAIDFSGYWRRGGELEPEPDEPDEQDEPDAPEAPAQR